MAKTAADLLVEALIRWGVDTIFGTPGDGINGISEALRVRREQVRFIQLRYVEAAASAATGDALQAPAHHAAPTAATQSGTPGRRAQTPRRWRRRRKPTPSQRQAHSVLPPRPRMAPSPAATVAQSPSAASNPTGAPAGPVNAASAASQ